MKIEKGNVLRGKKTKQIVCKKKKKIMAVS